MTYVLFFVLFYNLPRPTTYFKIIKMTLYRETVSDALKGAGIMGGVGIIGCLSGIVDW